MNPTVQFRVLYVTSGEIQKRVGITRSALTQAVQAGKFPGPLDLEEKLHIWDRSAVEAEIIAWANARNHKK